MSTVGLVVGCLTLAVASVTLFVMCYWRRPNLKLVIKGLRVDRLRSEKTDGRRVHATVDFQLIIYNKSATSNTVTDLSAYEVSSDGKQHLLRGRFSFSRVPGYLSTHFDVPANTHERRMYDGKDVELKEYRDSYLFRVVVTDAHGNKWPADHETKEVREDA